jgi:benzoylformate decarboxylase
MTENFTKWSDEVTDVSALPTMLRRAFRVALTPPTGPVFLSLPLDVMMDETGAEPQRLGAIPDAGRGDPEQVQRAADLFVEADRPVIVVGDGIARSGTEAVDAAVELAEATGARVHGEMMSSEISFPTDHEQWASFAPLAEGVIRDFYETDTIAFLSTLSNETLSRHDGDLVDPDTTCIHIGDEPWELGKNHPADAAVIGDPKHVLREVADRVREGLPADEHERRLENARTEVAEVQEVMAQFLAPTEDGPGISKYDLAHAMDEAIPDPLIVDEGITSTDVLMDEWAFGPEQLIANKGAGLGYGLPASVGAALAEGDRENPRDVIGFVGDGSYLYYPHSLYTAARYDIDLTVIVPDNRNYHVLKINTAAIFEEEIDAFDLGDAMDFTPPVDIEMNAKSHGARSRSLLDATPEEVRDAIAEAVDSDGPDVLDVGVHD